MTMQIHIRVKSIDPYGYNGRDHPPSRSHEGMKGIVTNINLIPDEDLDVNPDLPVPLQAACQVFHVVLDDGTPVELMGHEIELVSCTHDGDL